MKEVVFSIRCRNKISLGLRKISIMKFTAQVKVMPLKELLDPQGKAVISGLGNPGFIG